MFERTPELDRDPSRTDRTQEIRTPGRMRDGHRREYDPREARERMSFGERSEQALTEVGIYRSVSFRDLAEAHFGGHPYTARRAVNRWIREGLMREHTSYCQKLGTDPLGGDLVFTDSVYKCDVFYDLSEAPVTL